MGSALVVGEFPLVIRHLLAFGGHFGPNGGNFRQLHW